MAYTLEGAYGKQCVPVVKVRKETMHEVFDMTIETKLEGEFVEAYIEGDNKGILPTETQKNTCYAIALKHDFTCIEDYAIELGQHFMTNNAHFTKATIVVENAQWERLKINGTPHHHVFTRAPDPATKKFTKVEVTRSGYTITSGIKDYYLMKTTNSGFAGYIVDEYTDLKAVDPTAANKDRIMCTDAYMSWTYQPNTARGGFSKKNNIVMDTMLEIFAGPPDKGVYSKSVQETVYKMGVGGLAAVPELDSIYFKFPNVHHYVADMEKFGLKNPNTVFQKAGLPCNASGNIELTLHRNRSKL